MGNCDTATVVVQPPSSTFFAESEIFFTSAVPLATSFSIWSPAFFTSSGRVDLAFSIALSAFWCAPLAFLTASVATSAAF